ncbi:MAG: FecR domain-containing protein [Bacteroidota bacterium]
MKEKFEKDDTFLARWLAGELTDAELREFESDEHFESFKKIAAFSAALKTSDWKSKEEAWKHFKKTTDIAQKSPSAKIRSFDFRWLLAAAAIGILLVGYLAFFQNNIHTFSTPMAVKETFTLPDGSQVTLNASSKVAFDKKDFSNNRLLDLEGEAYFEVAEGSKFSVKTPNGSVEVLGTTFNVFSRKNKLEVNCYTGKVGVYFEDRRRMTPLNPKNGLIALNKKVVMVTKAELEKSPAWTSGNSKFSQVDFTEVIEELERQFDIKISYPEILKNIRDYNGGFPHDDLETALKVIFPAIGYQYKINKQEVTVFK